MRGSLLLLICGFAPAVAAERPRPLMKDFLGINGHTVQFKPEVYRPTSSLVRDYHPVEWDLGQDTSVLPTFPMAKNKVSWEQVYGSWKKKGYRIDASLMFESIPRERWTNLSDDAHAYGKALASAFGPSATTPLLESVEIGNEPGKWSDQDYAMILKSIAEGIRSGDPKLKIATCNLTTGKSGDYEKSVSCLDGLLPLIDVLNVHSYAQLEGWPTWKRSFPEDPALKNYLPDIRKLCEWRDTHCANKPVWLTEYGYDSTTKPSPKDGDFSKWQGVTDEQQAQWLVRSALIFSTLPIERAYLYFFDDKDEPQLHGSSGLTRNLSPKPSYFAMSQLQEVLGEFRFKRIIQGESGTFRIQEYERKGELVWAIWWPTGEGKKSKEKIGNLPSKRITLEPMRFKSGGQMGGLSDIGNEIEVEVSESPLYVRFKVAP